MLEADVVKNEITAHAVGTLSRCPEVRTILEIGGQDSKIILIEEGIVKDYAMNTLCAAGTGAFLSSQAKRLGIEVEEMGGLAMQSHAPSKIAARCTVFAESEVISQLSNGARREDVIRGVHNSVISRAMALLYRTHMEPAFVFTGGVAQNSGVVDSLRRELRQEVLVSPQAQLTGAIGAALLAQEKADQKGV